MKYKNSVLVVLVAATTGGSALPVYADAISPQIKNTGSVYSKEKPVVDFYGTGVGGRATEAMALRFEVERMLQDGEYEAAIPKAKKAVQLDPGTPECHLLLARALTKKFYAKEGEVDEKLLRECLYEWKLLWFHDADQFEQVEAKIEAKKMMRIAKMLNKRKMEEQKAQLAAKEALAKKRQQEAASGKGKETASADTDKDEAVASKEADKKDAAAETANATAEKKEPVTVAAKKKRFGIF